MVKVENQVDGGGRPFSEGMTIGYYFQTLTKLLGQPRRFFAELPVDEGWKRPFGFLLLSSLFFAGASVLGTAPDRPLLFASIFFFNAAGMTLIAAGAGYGVMVMFFGRSVPFGRLFSIYALSAGVTLLAAWIPFFIWLTEPWKWWLIGTGMTRGLKFRWWQALVIICVSIGVIFLLFWSVWPILISAN